MSSAVRPMAVAADEQFVYLQISFFHGFAEFDPASDKVTRLALLPQSEEAQRMSREEYVLNSAHHGIAMNPAGNTCAPLGRCLTTRRSWTAPISPPARDPGWRQAVLVHQQRRRQELLRLGQRRGPRGGGLLRRCTGDREHPRGRPSPADAAGTDPLGVPPRRPRRPRGLAHARVVKGKGRRARSLRLRLSESARVTVYVRRVRGQTNPQSARAAPVAGQGHPEGRDCGAWPAGRYRIQAAAPRDAAGNASRRYRLAYRAR